jgi:hypothetical protein
MSTRRRRGEDGISFEHRGPCTDPHRHRHCPGLWRGELTTGYTGDGKRQRRKVSGKTKAAVIDKLRDLHAQLDKGVTPKAGYAHYTVRQAAADWLDCGLEGRSPKTVTKNRNVLEPILAVIGARKLRDLTADDVRQALTAMAARYSTAAVSMGHLALKRAIRHAEANDLVARNVAILADTPQGQQGRPSRSLTLDQALAVITAAATLPVMELRPGLKDVRRPAELMHAYITLSLLAGLRSWRRCRTRARAGGGSARWPAWSRSRCARSPRPGTTGLPRSGSGSGGLARRTWRGCGRRGIRWRAGTARRMRRRSGSCWTAWTRERWPGPCSGRGRAAGGAPAGRQGPACAGTVPGAPRRRRKRWPAAG